MGFDLYSVLENEYFRVNIWGMGTLKRIITLLGININAKMDFKVPTEDEQQYETSKYTLEQVFSVNDGIIVSPEICLILYNAYEKRDEFFRSTVKEILIKEDEYYKKIIPKLISPKVDDENIERTLEFIHSFFKYCKKCSKLEGFRVC